MSVAPKSNLILMVDDDPDDRLLMQEALAECDFASELRFVQDGVELMDYLFRRDKFSEAADSPRPVFTLLDLNMPKKDGREALREIKLDPELKKIPVVVLTTSTADTDISRIYELGANSFISKPTAFDSLVTVMKAVGKYWFEVVALPTRIGLL